jgi:hypothetical protein
VTGLDPVPCRSCGHAEAEHHPLGCNAWHITGGGLGMMQRCGCTRYTTEKESPR